MAANGFPQSTFKYFCGFTEKIRVNEITKTKYEHNYA